MININKQSRKVVEDHQSPSTIHKALFPSQSNSEFRNQPCKSPSPDKKRANIITPTKSPQMIEIKRNMTPLRLSERRFQKTPIEVSSKNTYNEQSTKYYTNEDFQDYRSSHHKKNEVVQELEEMLPQQFVLNNSNGSRLRMSQYRSGQQQKKELDYIRLLQQKERTIKELHQIIEMINRNNSLDLSVSQLSGSKNKRSFQHSDKFLSSLESGQDKQQKQQLRQQIKTLTIQNQQLVHMIEKIQQREFKSSTSALKQSKYSSGDAYKYSNTEPQRYSNIDPHRYSSVDPSRQQKEQYGQRLKEENLMREVIALKQSLTIKQAECLQLNYQNKQLLNKYTQLDLQNQKLIKMMKDKQLSDRKYHASLIESTLSAQKSPQSSQIITNHTNINGFPNTREKLSLIKIKEQYNESLKIFKDTVCGDVEEFMTQMGRSFNRLQHKVIELQEQIRILERLKSAHENMKSKQKQSELIPLSIEHKGDKQVASDEKELRESFSKINELEQLSEIQMRSPQRGNNQREIESLLMKGDRGWGAERQQGQLREIKLKCQVLQQKYSLLEKEKRHLEQQCESLNSKCRQLQHKINTPDRKYEQVQQVRVSWQMGQSNMRRSQMGESKMTRRSQQIQDINIGRAQELQIKSLREMIRKYQSESEGERQLMGEQIQMLKSKNIQYERQIHSIRQQSPRPITQLQQARAQTLSANQQLSETRQQLLSSQSQLQHLINQLEEARSQIEQQKYRLEQKEQQMQELRQLILIKEQNQSHTHQQIQKLISNYSQEIAILKQTLNNEQLNYQHQVAKYQLQISRHLEQKQLLQQQKLASNRKYEQERILYEQNSLAHQQDIARYQQVIARYEEDIAKYQSEELRHQQERLRYEQEIEQLNIKIRKAVSQGENVERLMSDSQSRNKLQLEKATQQAKSMNQQMQLMKQQLKAMQQKMKSMQQKEKQMQQEMRLINQQLELKNYQLQTKTQAEHKWRDEEQQLRKQHQEMKHTVDRLLTIANQVQEMQSQRNKLADDITQLRQQLNQQKHHNNNLNISNSSLTQQITSLTQQLTSLTQQNNLLNEQASNLRQDLNIRQEQADENEKRRQSMSKRVAELQSELNAKNEEIEVLRQEMDKLRRQLGESQAVADRLRKQLLQQQSSSMLVRQHSQQLLSQAEHQRQSQQSSHTAQITQYQQHLSSLNTHIQHLTQQLQTLNSHSAQTQQQLADLQAAYNELLGQQENPLEELYDLRVLLNTKLVRLEAQGDGYDMGKLVIDYQFKCDQLLSLNTQLEQTKQQLVHTQSHKYLLEEKCLSLQKNLALYQSQLKQRKLLTENLLNQKTKLEKELALMKKTQLQTHQHQAQSLKLNLANLINKAIEIQEKRNLQLKQKALEFQQRAYRTQPFQQKAYRSQPFQPRAYRSQQKPQMMRTEEQQISQEMEHRRMDNSNVQGEE